MLSKKLEIVLNDTFQHAKSKKHEFMTVEHLLLELLDDDETRDVLLSVDAKIDDLKSGLNEYIESNVSQGDGKETQPTLGFQRVLQRAVFHVQSSGRKEVTGGNVLIAIFSEQESHAVYLLKQQGITRLDVVNYVVHSVSTNRSSSASYSSGTVAPDQVVEFEKSRLDNIESKVDQLLSELRELSEKVQKISDRLGPEEKS